MQLHLIKEHHTPNKKASSAAVNPSKNTSSALCASFAAPFNISLFVSSSSAILPFSFMAFFTIIPKLYASTASFAADVAGTRLVSGAYISQELLYQYPIPPAFPSGHTACLPKA